FDYLHSCIESQYQMFILSINNNMGVLYRERFNEWKSYLTDMTQGYKREGVLAAVPVDILNRSNPKKFESYYQAILENHMGLITILYENHKLIEAEEALKTFFTMEPSNVEENLRKIYISKLHELVLTVYLDHDVGFDSALHGLEQFCKGDMSNESNSGLGIYEDLILKAIERDEVDSVSSIVYSMIEPIQYQEDLKTNNEDLKVRLKFLKRYKRDQFYTKYRQCIIFITLRSILKSIELSRYSSTGFLLKFTVTNFYSLKSYFSFDLKRTFDVLVDSIKQNLGTNPYMDHEAPQSILPVTPNYNTNTLVYCLEKMSILLYGQQSFADKMKLNREKNEIVNNRKKINVSKVLSETNSLDYLFSKIILAKN